MSLFSDVIGAIGGASFGGGTKVTTNVDQKTNVAVEVNPQIAVLVEPQNNIALDLRPVADAIAQGNGALVAVSEAAFAQSRVQAQSAADAAVLTARAIRDGAIQGAVVSGQLQNATAQDAVAGLKDIAASVAEKLKGALPVLALLGVGALLLRKG